MAAGDELPCRGMCGLCGMCAEPGSCTRRCGRSTAGCDTAAAHPLRAGELLPRPARRHAGRLGSGGAALRRGAASWRGEPTPAGGWREPRSPIPPCSSSDADATTCCSPVGCCRGRPVLPPSSGWRDSRDRWSGSRLDGARTACRSDVAVRVGGAAAELRCEGDFWRLEFGGRGRWCATWWASLPSLSPRAARGAGMPALVPLVTERRPRAEWDPGGADAAAFAATAGGCANWTTRSPRPKVRRPRPARAAARHERDAAGGDRQELRASVARPRLGGDTANRARTNVRKAVTGCIPASVASMPELVHHLETHVKTGHRADLPPGPRPPVVWRTR